MEFVITAGLIGAALYAANAEEDTTENIVNNKDGVDDGNSGKQSQPAQNIDERPVQKKPQGVSMKYFCPADKSGMIVGSLYLNGNCSGSAVSQPVPVGCHNARPGAAFKSAKFSCDGTTHVREAFAGPNCTGQKLPAPLSGKFERGQCEKLPQTGPPESKPAQGKTLTSLIC